MSNPLTRSAGMKIAPVIFDTLLKHYLDKPGPSKEDKKLKKKKKNSDKVDLHHEEMLYDQAWNIIKTFLETAAFHSVEDAQAFSNTRTPSQPWIRSVRLLVPRSSCDEAATLLIKALGGEEHAKKVVGGTKWWQVRGVDGVNAHWIATKRDWKAEQMKAKVLRASNAKSPLSPKPNGNANVVGNGKTKDLPTAEHREHADTAVEETDQYHPEMDEMRCILYAHGGGYYFGSTDQVRYSIQRMAKKINGRMLAVDYRLAPQYPFPCALQDLLAAYIFLIRPPPGAAHRPVHPSLIVVGGDSAGGGLTLALLQVIRDSGLPLPAGGTLISPWCDLASSFPSIHSNVKTDVIPMWGLSLQKPSTLWPPPPPEIQEKVRQSLRKRIREFVHHDGPGVPHTVTQEPLHHQQDHNEALDKHTLTSPEKEVKKDSDTGKIDMGPTEKLPKWDDPTGDQSIVIATRDGKELTVEDQVQLYVQNSLILHPLVSPALGFLGGLPPLHFVIGDAEVLRDEGIYTAHKAAYPEKFPIDPEARDMYPPLQDPELLKKYGPTPVHLQVYDDCAHDMPMLFAFTTPAKYCFRAMAQFMKHVSGRNDVPSLFSASSTQSFESSGFLASPRSDTSSNLDKPLPERPSSRASGSEESFYTGRSESPDLETEPSTPKKPNGALPPLDTDTDRTPRKESLGQKLTSALYTSSPGAMSSSRSSTASTQNTPTNEAPTPKATIKASQPQANGNGPVSLGNPNNASYFKDPFTTSNGDANPAFTTEPKPMETLHEDDEHDPSHTPRRQTVSNAGLSLKTDALARGGSPASTTRTRPRRDSEVSTSQASSSRSRKSTVRHRMSSLFLGRNRAPSVDSEDVAGPRFGPSTSRSSNDSQRYGGDPIVYQEPPPFPSMEKRMIRERVNIQGVIRPMEPEDQMTAFQLKPEAVGRPSELTMRRYLDGKALFDKKFSSVARRVEKYRKQHLERARQDTVKNMIQLSNHISDEKQAKDVQTKRGIVEGLQSMGSWSWSWVLDPDERPPPSSIVSRRDTSQALQLARVADQSVIPGDGFSGNYLWGMLMNFLTAGPGGDDEAEALRNTIPKIPGGSGLFGRLMTQNSSPKKKERSMSYFDDIDIDAAVDQAKDELYDRNH